MTSPPLIPPERTLDIPLRSSDSESITIDLASFGDHDTCTLIQHDTDLNGVLELLQHEHAELSYWIRIIEELWRLKRYNSAMQFIEIAIQEIGSTSPSSRHVLHVLQANYLLSLSRRAPKLVLPHPRSHAPLVHPTNASHPESRDPNPDNPPLTKEAYWGLAKSALEEAERAWQEQQQEQEEQNGLVKNKGESKIALDVKAALLLARGGSSNLDAAARLYDRILQVEPTNLIALMGKARTLFSRRSFRPALKAYQTVLSLAPLTFLPDPRIGVGLCFYMLGERERAQRAWERSSVVHPTASSTPCLLLGLKALNSSRDPTLPGGEAARGEQYKRGMEYVSRAFKMDNTQSAAAGAVAGHYLLSKKPGTIKLAERAIQFADTRLLLSEGHLTLARALQSQIDPQDQQAAGGDKDAAQQEYKASLDANPEQVMAGLAIAQGFLRTGEIPPAVNQYETILRRQPRCLEALVSLASIHTHLAFSYRSASDAAAARKRAKELYDQILRIFASGKEAAPQGNGNGTGTKGEGVNRYVAKSERVKAVAADKDMFIEIARLWGDEGQGERSLKAYQEAARLVEEEADAEVEVEVEAGGGGGGGTDGKTPSPLLLNNIGVLQFQQGHLDAALAAFERALTDLAVTIAKLDGVVGEKEDAVLVPLTFNRGVVLEALGEAQRAKEECYEQILERHPEYVEAKARLALIAMSTQGEKRKAELDRAHSLIKETLTSQMAHPELRALYTYYLIEIGQHEVAQTIARASLRDYVKHDVYSMCAMGMLAYLDARELRDPHPDAPQAEEKKKHVARERRGKFLKAAEYFDKALAVYPQCAFAAQGLAIGIAENTLGTGMDVIPANGAGVGGGGRAAASATALTPAAITAKNTRDALNILIKVKESVNDASVYINIGHCHFAREEWERAIESYETAAHRYHKGKSISSLLYLARAWYHKATKDQNFGNIQKALESCQAALALNPTDLASLWNVALVQQKGVEILWALPVERRNLAEIHLAMTDAERSQATFDQLANDSNSNPPYQKQMPKMRHQYGQGLLNKAPAVIEAQTQYESTEEARLAKAKAARDEERARIAAEEEARRQAQRERDEAIAEQRRKMREEAASWQLSQPLADSDDDGKEAKKKEKKAAGAGKKRAKKVKAEEGSGSEEEEPKPKKKRAKAAPKSKGGKKDKETSAPAEEMDLDEDGEEAVRGGNKRKGRGGKPIKSAEYVDTDSEDE